MRRSLLSCEVLVMDIILVFTLIYFISSHGKCAGDKAWNREFKNTVSGDYSL